MKLYYAPGASSLAAHIVLREEGLAFRLVKVDLSTHRTEDGGDFYAINPKGCVPAIELDDGTVITEVSAIMQHLADLKPESRLVPVQGSIERVKLREWLSFIAMELHKGFSPLWNPACTGEWRAGVLAMLEKHLDFPAKRLRQMPYLMGSVMTAADIYLFVILRWAKPLHIDIDRWPSLADFIERIGNRPQVLAALRTEGLIA